MLPQRWSDEKRDREMQVPQWLITTINKCLEKSPGDRFKNGMELHQYIVHHSTLAAGSRDSSAMNTMILQSENERLRTLVLKYQEDAKQRESAGVPTHKVLSLNEVLSHKIIEQPEVVPEVVDMPTKRRKPIIDSMLYFFLLISIAAVVYIFRDKINLLDKLFTGSKSEVVADTISQRTPIVQVQYRVQAPKAYFHNSPAENTKREAYMIASGEKLTPLKETSDFIYIEFTNGTKLSKGWLRKKDLAEWSDSTNSRINSPTSNGEKNNRVQDGDAKFASQ